MTRKFERWWAKVEAITIAAVGVLIVVAYVISRLASHN